MTDNSNTDVLSRISELLTQISEGQIIINITKGNPKKIEILTKVFEKIEN